MESLTGARDDAIASRQTFLMRISGNRSGVWGHFAQSEKL